MIGAGFGGLRVARGLECTDVELTIVDANNFTLLTRTFPVDAAPTVAWQHLIDVERWPSWAHHLRKVEVTPRGPVVADTHAVLTLTNRTRATVIVTDLVDGHRFRWDGRFLWLRLGYDHCVEPRDARGSEITFTVLGGGFGISTLGRLFARIYARNLDRAIPRLQRELEPTRVQPSERPS